MEQQKVLSAEAREANCNRKKPLPSRLLRRVKAVYPRSKENTRSRDGQGTHSQNLGRAELVGKLHLVKAPAKQLNVGDAAYICK